MPIRLSLSSSSLSLLLLSFTAAPLLVGCASTNSGSSQTSATPAVRAKVVEAGQQPVSGASIQLYAVGTTSDKSAATPLFLPALTTDFSGNFSIGSLNCPSPTALVYIVATGGNPTSSGSSINPNLAMMTVLGQCSSLTNSSFTINELTTVAAAYALAPFMSSVSTVGSGTSDAASLAAAFSLSALLVNPVTGTAGGSNSSPFPAVQATQPSPRAATVPASEINLLGDIIATCVDSTGGTAGDGSACGTLFSLTTVGSVVPTDTVAALLNLASDPTLNTAALTALVKPGAPFQPVSSVVPPNLGVQVLAASGFSVFPSLLSFGSLPIGFPSTSQTVTLTNNGSIPVLIGSQTGSIVIIGTDASDFVILNNAGASCDDPLQPGQSCTIPLQFTPQGAGARNAYLEISNNSSNPEIYIPLSGQGTVHTASGPITLSSSSLSFTEFGVPQNVTLTNLGNSPLAIGGINFGTNPHFTETDNCGTSLAAQSICTIAVTALAAGNTTSAVMTVIDDATAGSQTMNVAFTTSNVVVGPELSFGSWAVGTSVPGQLSIRASSRYANLGSVYGVVSGPNASDFSGGPSYIPCSNATITSCSMSITFSPSAVGPRTATLTLRGASGPLGAVSLSGTGQPAGINFFFSEGVIPYIYQTSSFYFPQSTINTPISNTLSIYNSGSVSLSLHQPVITGTGAAQFSASDSGCANLPPVSYCQLTISTTASQLGATSATMTITDSTNTVQKSLALSNYGVATVPSVSSSFQTFYAQLGGTSAAQTVTVSAYNHDPVSVSVGTSYPQFTIAQGSTCTSTPCQLSMTFTPTQLGSAGGIFTVTDTAQGGSTVVNTLFGIGTNGLPAVTLTPSTLSFPLRSVGTTSIAQTVTLTNTGTGTAPLSLSGISLAANNPGDYVLNNGCGTSLATGANCAFTVSFSPIATGTRTASVQVLSNAGTSPDTVTLSGTAQ